jgi:hypothetical protein
MDTEKVGEERGGEGYEEIRFDIDPGLGLLLHGRALLGLGGRGRWSHLGDIARIIQADHLDTVERVQIAIPLAEDNNILGA